MKRKSKSITTMSLTRQLEAKKQPVPPLDEVEDTIREVLIQRAINERAAKWLDDTREQLKIDIVAQGGQQ